MDWMSLLPILGYIIFPISAAALGIWFGARIVKIERVGPGRSFYAAGVLAFVFLIIVAMPGAFASSKEGAVKALGISAGLFLLTPLIVKGLLRTSVVRALVPWIGSLIGFSLGLTIIVLLSVLFD